jgi:hypothetical protein
VAIYSRSSVTTGGNENTWRKTVVFGRVELEAPPDLVEIVGEVGKI